MSEHQYYEFVTVGRRLTKAEMDALRAISTRATITPTSFVNTYNYGDLKADPTSLLARYFDARLYVANWGQRQFAVSVPKGSLPAKATKPYEDVDSVSIRRTGAHAVVTFEWSDEDGGWVDDGEAAASLRELLPLRDRLLRGDLSPLYVGWLASIDLIYDGDEEDGGDRLEPPVPPALTASSDLSSLTEFLGVEGELLEAAAEAVEGDGAVAFTPAAFKRWVATQPATKQQAWLTRVAAGDGGAVEAELGAAFQRAAAPKRRGASRRSVAALIARAQEIYERRRTKRRR